jgi:nitrate reductase (NAD(P)H)
MIKWIEEICVSEVESDNWYHYNDNRVLPSHVDAAMAAAEGWWYKPDYIINDLNINSAILYPAHDEVLPLNSTGSGANATGLCCKVKGYAYSNGNKIIRCELTLDDGKSWRLADIVKRAEPNEYGKHWGWVWWEIDVPVADLLATREMACRAWDHTQNTQPNTFTWNVMGMMNNCIYRVKINPGAIDGGALFGLAFEHPTLAGTAVGGWMNRASDDSGGTTTSKGLAAPHLPLPTTITANGSVKLYTMKEVEKHDTKDSAWFVYEGKVIDATPFLKEHPGGADSILLVAGTDATEEFNAIHSDKAKKQLMEYYIGDLYNPTKNTNGTVGNGLASSSLDLVALNPKKRIPFKLIQKDILSHNVRRFRFALQSREHRFGLPVGKHVFVYAKIDNELVMRAYTPTTLDTDLGHFDLVVKIYFANEHPRFPAGGKLSQYLESLNMGDEVEVKGPVGHMHYMGRGRFTLDGEERHASRFSLLSGGTGITPCYQVVKSALEDPEDQTKFALLYANVSPDDILLKEELDTMAAENPERFSVWYTVDEADENWTFSTGFINKEMIESKLFPAVVGEGDEEGGGGVVACMCGPPPMIKFACKPGLEAVGYSESQMIEF